MASQTGPAVDDATRELSRLRSLLHATQFVCSERERELLELKGPCSARGCRLHYAHAGPCDVHEPAPIGSQAAFDSFARENRMGDPVRLDVMAPPRGHGWTTHGHWCCNLVPHDPSTRPAAVARCMGPPGCSKCATEAVRLHVAGA